MSAIAEFVELLGKKAKEGIPIQTVWAVCKSVDWNAKKMVATGLVDNLDYQDISLGNGFEFKKPPVGASCLLGIIQNNGAMTYLIDANEIEEYLIVDKTGFKFHLKDGKLSLNGEQFGGLVNAKELKIQIDKNTNAIKSLQQILSAWVPVAMDGGASLKGLITTFTTSQTANLQNIENKAIKHGNEV
jgi:hypothetical protein